MYSEIDSAAQEDTGKKTSKKHKIASKGKAKKTGKKKTGGKKSSRKNVAGKC